MRKVLLIGWREVKQMVRSRSFILTTVGLPVFLVVIWTATGMMGNKTGSTSIIVDMAKAEHPELPVGYVDQAGLIKATPPGIPDGLFISFQDESAATAALKDKRIGAYYVLSSDYLSTGEAKRVSSRLPLIAVDRRFIEWIVEFNLLPGRSVDELARLRSPFGPDGLQFVPVGPEGLPKESQSSPGFAPFVVAMIIMMPLFTAGGFLLQGLAQEKENRVIEILLVSVRPWQLLAGKLVGLSSLTLLQFCAWLFITGLMVRVTGAASVDLLRLVDLSGGRPYLLVAFAAGGFVLYATLMAGLGALAPNVESTRTWSFIIGSPMLLPIFLMTSIVSSPNGPVAVALSIMPFSAPVAMLMRLMMTPVSPLELTLSLALLTAASVLMLLLISRLFRATTLLSGQPLSAELFWKAILQR